MAKLCLSDLRRIRRIACNIFVTFRGCDVEKINLYNAF